MEEQDKEAEEEEGHGEEGVGVPVWPENFPVAFHGLQKMSCHGAIKDEGTQQRENVARG